VQERREEEEVVEPEEGDEALAPAREVRQRRVAGFSSPEEEGWLLEGWKDEVRRACWREEEEVEPWKSRRRVEPSRW
jgi:hypothetical protein